MLLDVSGSMTLGGQQTGRTRLQTAIRAVELAVNSLSTSDFFNVIVFNDEVRTVSCFDKTLARATNLNKREVLNGLAEVEAEGGTNFVAAFERAFDMLEFSANNASSQCEATILFITDGISGDPRQLIRERQARLRLPARIFSYSISTEADRRMAYNIAKENNGAFNTVRDDAPSGQLARIMGEYYNYFGDGFAAWSPPYFDANGLGLMVTRSEPVFEERSEGDSASTSSTLIGVVGVDVTLSEVEEAVLNDLASEDSYAFLVNRDGEAVVHPRLKVHASPNFPDVAVLEASDSDLDFRAEFERLVRRPLLLRIAGTARMVMPRLYSKGDASTEGVRKEYQNVTYAFTQIIDTDFMLCLALLDSFVAPRELAPMAVAEWRARDAAVRVREAMRGGPGAGPTTAQPAVYHSLFKKSSLQELGGEYADQVTITTDPDSANHPGVPVSYSHSMFALAPKLYCDTSSYLKGPCSRPRTETLLELVNEGDEYALCFLSVDISFFFFFLYHLCHHLYDAIHPRKLDSI